MSRFPVPGGLLLFAGLLLGGPCAGAAAAGVPLGAVVTGNGGQARLRPDLFVVRQLTPGRAPLELAVATADRTPQGRVTALNLFVLRDGLTPGELKLLAASAGRVAAACFGLGAGSRGDLLAWLSTRPRRGPQDLTRAFGPVQVGFTRGTTGDGAYTSVSIARGGTPGGPAWKGYCTN